MKAFRIALARYGSTGREVFSGLSGFSADGRWHSRGRHLDYAAEHLSLAVLERLVHYKRFDQLQPHVLCTVDLPDDLILTVPEVPVGWDGLDLLPQAQRLGDAWCDGLRSPAMRVPSAVTSGEFNFLLNSAHPAWRWEWVTPPQAFRLDRRLEELMEGARRRGA